MTSSVSAHPTGTIGISCTDGVAIVVIDNPARHNALSLAMWRGLAETLRKADADADVRCIILRGAGDKAFAAGADISEFEKVRASAADNIAYDDAVEAATGLLYELRKPTIAMVGGICYGGGMAIAVNCDIRIVATHSRFAIPAAKLGVGYGYVGINRLSALVGPSRSKEIFFTARAFDADEAYAMGLANRLVAPEELEKTTINYAKLIAENAPLTIASVKLSVAHSLREPGERDIMACEASARACFDSQDYIEGRRAFMEKRKPVFSGA